MRGLMRDDSAQASLAVLRGISKNQVVSRVSFVDKDVGWRKGREALAEGVGAKLQAQP